MGGQSERLIILDLDTNGDDLDDPWKGGGLRGREEWWVIYQ